MKGLLTLFAVILAMLSGGIPCAADEFSEIAPSEIYDSMDIDDSAVYSALPEEAGEILSENGVCIDDAGRFTELTPSELIGYLLDRFKDKLNYPLKALGVMIAAAVLSAGVSAFSETVSSGGVKRVYEMVSVMAAAAVVTVPVADCLNKAVATVKAGGTFMLAYVPVYAGIAASSGAVTSAAAYNVTVIAAAEGAVVFSAEIMLPLLSCCMALGIAGGISDKVSLGSLTVLITKICTISLTAVMTIFTGLLSLQSALGTAADSLGIKTAKLALSNFVPVVGGALSDTYTAVRSGLVLLKGAAGIYGIAAAALIILPPAIEAAALYFSVNIGAAVSDILGQSKMAKLFKSTSQVLGMVLGILLCFGAMLIISTGILMVRNPS